MQVAVWPHLYICLIDISRTASVIELQNLNKALYNYVKIQMDVQLLFNSSNRYTCTFVTYEGYNSFDFCIIS